MGKAVIANRLRGEVREVSEEAGPVLEKPQARSRGRCGQWGQRRWEQHTRLEGSSSVEERKRCEVDLEWRMKRG